MKARVSMAAPALQMHPLTPERWADFERLFSPRGACAGCWCMGWRLPAAEWRTRRGDANRQAFREVVRRARRRAGFTEVARRSPTRPMLRCELAGT